MRIAFLGNFRPRTALGEPFSTESHLAATYEFLGHQVLRLQEDETPKRSIPAQCQEFGADLFHWVDTWHTDFPGAAWMLDELRHIGIPSVGYTLDLFVGLDRETWLDTDPWFHCDYFFSADGGHPDVWTAKGINHHWMPPAVYAPECYLAEPVPELEREIVFVGSGGYHAAYPHRKRLLQWLSATYGTRFRHYDHDSAMRGHRLNQLYASAKVCVGDSCLLDDAGRYHSDRIPETAGRGGFLIHPFVMGVMDGQHYQQGEHVATWQPKEDFDQLRERIDYFLTDHQERERIRLSGHEHVKANHTYTHRLQQVLAIIRKGTP